MIKCGCHSLLTALQPPPAQVRTTECPDTGAEVSHADQDPLARDPTCRPGLVGGQLPAAGGLPGILHRAVSGTAGAAHRRPGGAGARSAAGGPQLAAQLESLMGPAGRELVSSILSTSTPQGGMWATVVGLSPSSSAPRRSSARSRRR